MMISKYHQQIKDSLCTSLLVGSLLIFINHTEAILHLTFTAIDAFQWMLNFVVPFTVSLYSRISALKKRTEAEKKIIDA